MTEDSDLQQGTLIRSLYENHQFRGSDLKHSGSRLSVFGYLDRIT